MSMVTVIMNAQKRSAVADLTLLAVANSDVQQKRRSRDIAMRWSCVR